MKKGIYQTQVRRRGGFNLNFIRNREVGDFSSARKFATLRVVYILLILLVLSIPHLKGQGLPDDKRAKHTLLVQLFGPELFGLYYNHNLTDYFSLNAGFGWGTSGHIGFNYYPLKVRNCIYIGAQACLLTQINLGDYFTNYGSQTGIYFPVGLQLTALKGFTFQFEAGYNIFKEDYSQRNTQPFIFAIRIGKTWFKQKR